MAFRNIEPRARLSDPGRLKVPFLALATHTAFRQRKGLKLALWTLELSRQVKAKEGQHAVL